MKNWEPDKWKHFWVGIPLGLFLISAPGYFIQIGFISSLLIALISLIAICYGFELVSLITGRGHYDMMDVVAGVAGGILWIAAGCFFIAN